MLLAFATANYVGRATGYALHPFDWDAAERATVERFSSAEWEAICAEVAVSGFRAVEIWRAHAWPATLTPEGADDLLAALQRQRLMPIGLAGGLGEQPDVTLRAARLLGVGLVSGSLGSHDPREVARLARQRLVRVAIENEHEHDPQQLRAAIGLEEDVLGACIDTGAWLTQGVDPAQAIHALGQQVWQIHLKDIRAAGTHETVQLGTGIMDLPAVIAAIKAIGYDGAVSIEHEPAHFDPSAEVRAGRELAAGLLGI